MFLTLEPATEVYMPLGPVRVGGHGDRSHVGMWVLTKPPADEVRWRPGRRCFPVTRLKCALNTSLIQLWRNCARKKTETKQESKERLQKVSGAWGSGYPSS